MRKVAISDALFTLCSCGTMPCGISYITEPSHSKTGNPFYSKAGWLIEKIGDINGFVGGNYGNIVNNQREREDIETDFVPLPLWNGKGIHLNKFLVKHIEKGTVYLKVMVNIQNTRVQYRWIDNQEPLSAEDVQNLNMYAPATSVSSRQGTEKPIYWQTINVCNIIQLRFKGEIYEIVTE